MRTQLRLRHRRPAPRALRGHPWAFAGELEELPDGAPVGEGVDLFDARGRALGAGVVNLDSKIRWRRYGAEGVVWGPDFWRGALERAEARRDAAERYQRLVWSEADDLPGLVVDRFDDVLVVQALTRAVAEAQPILTELLQERWSPREILFRNDAPSRHLEGLPFEVSTASGTPLAGAWHAIDGVSYWLDLQNAQKTGFYLDQRRQHMRVAALAKGRRVLDVFCNQGSFALQAARAGATSVQAIDSSESAIEQARGNAARNDLKVEFIASNAFDWLTAHRTERYDLIVLDPPSFAPNRRAVEGAMRGYKQLHLRAFEMLNPGGVLATYSCSHHIGREAYLDMITAAALDVGRPVRLLEHTDQPPDHPVRLGFPESAYLKGALLIAD